MHWPRDFDLVAIIVLLAIACLMTGAGIALVLS